MTSTQLAAIQPLASPLPPPPEGDVLTPEQWKTMFAIGDAVLPPLTTATDGKSESHDTLSLSSDDYAKTVSELTRDAASSLNAADKKGLIQAYLEENASSLTEARDLIHRQLSAFTRKDARDGLLILLSALNTTAGCILFTQSTTLFHHQTIAVRHQIMQNWNNSYLPMLRQAAKLLSSLWKIVWLRTSPTYRKLLGMPLVPVHGTPGKGFGYQFMQFSRDSSPAEVSTDVVIVGSGCGGAVCAKNLAEAGHKVLVVDKANYFPPEHLPMSEKDGTVHLFENGGMEQSDDAQMIVLSGSAWGGGGTVNWSASLQTQDFVRKEWAGEGLSFFTSAEFQNCLDRVCERMGASTEHIQHNKTNQILMEGSRKLGFNCNAVPQNTGGAQHYCGYCSLGCGSAEKQGPGVSWLPDAARAGALFIEGFTADKVIFEKISGKKTAVGVSGTWVSRDSKGGVEGPLSERIVRKVNVRANRVIVSGGTLQSPLLLMRSGLTNPHIGRHLHLHPVNIVFAAFPEELRPWEGGILTTVTDSLQNQDGYGHGVKLEAVTMLPSMSLPFIPWVSADQWKRAAASFSRMAGFISLARDRDTGRVYPDKNDGKCRIAYATSNFDKKHILEGVIALCKICYVAGAESIFCLTAGVPVYERKGDSASDAGEGVNNPRFQAWLDSIRKKGLPAIDSSFGSAHQMGTCRMAVSERAGVVDTKGKVFGTEGLYVADASVFPSASGVNPMITNMAISDYTSRLLAEDMKSEESKGRMTASARL